jgi:hypothetical protein
MSDWEAIVWIVGIIAVCITITSVARSFAGAIATVRKTQHELKEGSNETPNAPEGR